MNKENFHNNNKETFNRDINGVPTKFDNQNKEKPYDNREAFNKDIDNSRDTFHVDIKENHVKGVDIKKADNFIKEKEQRKEKKEVRCPDCTWKAGLKDAETYCPTCKGHGVIYS